MGRGKFPQRYGEQDVRAPFAPMKFPESVTISKISSKGYRNAFAMDTDGGLWVWGYKLAYDDYYGENEDEDPDWIPNYKDSWTPCKIEWFSKNNIKIIDVEAGEIFAVVKTKDKNGGLAFYGILTPDYHYQAKNTFGANTKEIIKKTLYKLEAISASKNKAFSCGSYMTMYVNKPQEKVLSIIPDCKTSSGLTHVYKDNGKWSYVPEDEYEAHKDKLPGLCLAIRYPFADFEAKAM